MALTTTTLASACGLNDSKLVLTSATGVAAGYIIQVDQEMFQVVNSYSNAADGVNVSVLRAQDGTVAQAHPAGANATHGLASDTGWGSPAPQTSVAFPIAGRARQIVSYTADGAITLPAVGNDMVAILNGTVQWDMTLANPAKDQDGSILWIVSNGKAAHTVTYTVGLGNAGTGYTVATYTTGSLQSLALMAVNGIWCQAQSQFSGTLTAIQIALA